MNPYINLAIIILTPIAIISATPRTESSVPTEFSTTMATQDTEAERAKALKANGLTLEKCIKSASAECGGTAVFANVHIGKRGNFGVNVDCVVKGERCGATIDEKGKTTKKQTTDRDRKSEADYPKIAKELETLKVTLGEIAALAEKEHGGIAFNSWGYVNKSDGKVLVRVLVFIDAKTPDGKPTTKNVSYDPKTKKPV